MLPSPSTVPIEPRFRAVYVDGARAWAILDSVVFDERYLVVGVTKEQAQFGVMMLNNEGIGQTDDFGEMQYEISEAIEPIVCVICEKHFMRAQMHDDRCPADQT